MTVSTEACYAERAWTGVETSFAPGFPAASRNHIRVAHRDASGNRLVLSLGVHFDVALAADTRIATVLPLALPDVPGMLEIERKTPATQQQQFRDDSRYSERLHEDQADFEAMRSAEMRRRAELNLGLIEGLRGDTNANRSDIETNSARIDGLIQQLPNGGIMNWTASPPGSTPRTVGQKIGETYDMFDAGGVRDNPLVDNTEAINRFFREAAIEGRGLIPRGRFYFSQPLDPVVANDFVIDGRGPRSRLIYNGPDTATDLLPIGDAGTPTSNIGLRRFTLTSATALTAGNALRMTRVAEVDFDLRIGDGNFRLANGAVFDRCSYLDLHKSVFATRATNLAMLQVIEGHCGNSRIAGQLVGGHGSGVGLLISDCSGIYGEGLRQLYNEFGCIIDTSASGVGNQQVFLRTAIFDSNKTAAVWVDDSVSNPVGKVLEVPWCASTTVGSGLVILNWRNGDVVATIAQLRNNAGHGANILDTTINWYDSEATVIADNLLYGIDASAPLAIRSSAWSRDNALGLYGPNVKIVHDVRGMAVALLRADEWLTDVSNLSFSLANGANRLLPVGSGEYLIALQETGDVMKVLVGGAGIQACTATGTSTSGNYINGTVAPGAGKWSVGWDGTAYRIYNNTGATVTVIVAPQFRIRDVA